MSDITMTAVFEKVNEDYGADIVWTSGGSFASYKNICRAN